MTNLSDAKMPSLKDKIEAKRVSKEEVQPKKVAKTIKKKK